MPEFKASRVAAEFAKATLEVDNAQQRLQDIEDTLYDQVGTLDRFRKDYASRGGEKYRPDPQTVKCEHSLMFML